MLKNKTVLFLTHNYNSFQKDQIEELAKYFKRVYVLVRYKPIAEIGVFFRIPGSINHSKKYAIDLTSKPKNVTVIPVPLWYLPFDWFYKKLGIWHFYAVDKIIRQKNIKFDLIHSHFVWSAGYVGAKLKEKYQKPLIITGLGYDIYDLPFRNKFWKENITKVLNLANHVITVSKSNFRYLEKLKVQSPTSIVPNGYNIKLFYPKNQVECRKKLNLSLDKKIILTIGNLVKVKGHKYLIKAIDILRKEQKNILCLIIGDGVLKSSLQEQINSLKLQDSIKLLGKFSHNRLNDWINASDIFALPSISESFGVVQLEAMACGKPVVASNTGGIPEILKSIDYGLLHNKGDAKDLERKISQALKKKWNTNAILEYVKHYSNGNWSRETLNVIQKVISNK